MHDYNPIQVKVQLNNYNKDREHSRLMNKGMHVVESTRMDLTCSLHGLVLQ